MTTHEMQLCPMDIDHTHHKQIHIQHVHVFYKMSLILGISRLPSAKFRGMYTLEPTCLEPLPSRHNF